MGAIHITDYSVLASINRRTSKNYHHERIRYCIFETINQQRSSKKQPNENAIFDLILEKLEAIAINKEQLTERLSYLVEIKDLEIKRQNDASSFYIINNESESSESSLNL